jgi:predicted PurR-regulated permease PerM
MVEQSKPFIYLLVGLASVFIIIAGIQDLAFILNPILLSIVITIALIPVPGWFARRGVPGWLSLVLTFVLVLGFIGIVLVLVFFGLARLAEVLPSIQAGVTAEGELLDDVVPSALFGYRLIEIRDAATAFLTSEQLTGLATRFLSVLFTTVSQAFLVMLIFAFMLSAALSLPSSSRLGLQTDHPLVKQAAALTEDVRRYITLTTSLNLLAGILNTILLLAMGIGPAVLWGLLSWFMGYIPAGHRLLGGHAAAAGAGFRGAWFLRRAHRLPRLHTHQRHGRERHQAAPHGARLEDLARRCRHLALHLGLVVGHRRRGAVHAVDAAHPQRAGVIRGHALGGRAAADDGHGRGERRQRAARGVWARARLLGSDGGRGAEYHPALGQA